MSDLKVGDKVRIQNSLLTRLSLLLAIERKCSSINYDFDNLFKDTWEVVKVQDNKALIKYNQLSFTFDKQYLILDKSAKFKNEDIVTVIGDDDANATYRVSGPGSLVGTHDLVKERHKDCFVYVDVPEERMVKVEHKKDADMIKLNDTVKVNGLGDKLFEVIYLFEKGGIPRANLLHMYVDEYGNPRREIHSNDTLSCLVKQDESTLPKLKTSKNVKVGDVVIIKGFDKIKFNVTYINRSSGVCTLTHLANDGRNISDIRVLDNIALESLQHVGDKNE